MRSIVQPPGRINLVRFKPSPSHWHRGPCLASPCRRASDRGGLCSSHSAQLADNVRLDLLTAGLELDVLRAQIGDGYVQIYLAGGRGPYSVHRLVMEAVYGRRLGPGENVHHRNGVRHDNSVDNLELWVTSQPAGQRPADLVAWAHTILDRYEEGSS